MNRHRNIIFSAGLLAAIAVATPVAAHASPLLSGYGGPGQGSQMILGSSLLNGPGGGGAAAAGEASTAATRGGLGSAPAAGEASTAATRGGLGSGTAGSTSRSSASAVHAAHGAVLRLRSSSAAPAGTPGVARGTPGGVLGTYPARQAAPPALGVSEQDVLYIVLALGILAFAGVLTRRLTYPRSGPARGAE
jgi:hypothetical protein